ncbi:MULTISPECIES: fimbrial biogenesis chaperone [Pseudomonas]|uniref:Fimbria/pilus periplasmic chaperone n=2 Tax=Pseudomonas TaxID=286 RepID=A0ABX6H914_9PSED|nr:MULTISPECIES: molecular chaperone [Pseudomonas]MBC3954653.1 molecular chaperone [Pseudomonas triticifolii]QHF02049.1 fimbria/pilus periplasmic chaperone [Pseudomonas asturiensis]
MTVRRSLQRLLPALLLSASVEVQAALSLTGTRLIFDGRYREASLDVSNRGHDEVLAQAWLSDPRDDDDTPLAQRRTLPFVVTPPLSRLAAGGRQTLRVLYQGAGMPQERESLLHLYVLEVPQRHDGIRQLNIAVRQRINVFYRPVGLEGDPADTAERLNWTLTRREQGGLWLHVSNPTAYYASLERLSLDDMQVTGYVMLAPGARLEFPLPERERKHFWRRLSFEALTDYGGRRRFCAYPNGQSSFTASLLDNTSLQEKC